MTEYREYQDELTRLLSEMDVVEAVGQYHRGMMYDEVSVYLNETERFSIHDIGGNGYYRIITYEPLGPVVELEIKRYPQPE